VCFAAEDGKAEFVPLDQWEKEYHMHQQISQLKVFQLFQKWKSFRLWRRAVTRYKTKTNRTALEKTVFVLNPVFQLPLVAVRNVRPQRLIQTSRRSPPLADTTEP
jgi:hypothetical protein